MRRSLPLPAGLLALLLSACATGSTPSPGGGGATTTHHATGTGGAPACVGTLDLSVDGAASEHLTSICGDLMIPTTLLAPVAYIHTFSNPPAPAELVIVACATPGAVSEGIEVRAQGAAGPGTYQTGETIYFDPNGMSWGYTGDPIQVDVTALEAVGGHVDGTFSATTTIIQNNEFHKESGSFHACRIADQSG